MYNKLEIPKRVTLNLPLKLLQEAQKVTGRNITETIIAGLTIIRRMQAYTIAMQMKGKIKLNKDLETSRERRR